MISVSISDIQIVIGHYELAIQEIASELKSALDKLHSERTDPNEKKYVAALLKVHKDLITAEPKKLTTYQKKFEKLIPGSLMASASREGFRKAIIKTLGYSTLRSNFYPQYFQKIGIKSCVYCNSQLTLSVNKVSGPATPADNPIRAKFQVDHYLSKNEYPGLSISLFNLYPACANCNVIKGVKKIKFDLYTDKLPHSSNFFFRLAPASKLKYLLDRNPKDVEVTFEEPDPGQDFNSFNNLFDIDGIYGTQSDVVEDLILKAEIYTPAYRDALRNSFPHIFSNPATMNQLLIGNYTAESDIHKRPLVKFNIDLCKQLGLIANTSNRDDGGAI